LAVADVPRQQLELVREGAVGKVYRVSTSALGVGNGNGSHKTPPGFHEVAERYGAGHPAGAVFRERRHTGEMVPPAEWRGARAEDLITSRILRLRGLEPKINRGPGIDSYERCIYLHGTNHEDLLGTPASGGCIRMGNRDIIDLFDRVSGIDLWCWIGAPV